MQDIGRLSLEDHLEHHREQKRNLRAGGVTKGRSLGTSLRARKKDMKFVVVLACTRGPQLRKVQSMTRLAAMEACVGEVWVTC